MSHFAFRLRALLVLRHSERDQRRADLAAALAAERRIAMRRAALEAELQQQRQWVRRGASPSAIDVPKLRAAAQYETALRAQLEQAAVNRETAADEIERSRQALVAAESAVRALEKLRERQHDEFLRARALAEAKQLDEVAARLHCRRSPAR